MPDCTVTNAVSKTLKRGFLKRTTNGMVREKVVVFEKDAVNCLDSYHPRKKIFVELHQKIWRLAGVKIKRLHQSGMDFA